MHKRNIEILRKEAQRQLQLLKALLQKSQKNGLINNPAEKASERTTFDTESLPKVINILDGEHYKLENLEMVLAVVGTMKAGKSTSINAIVGAEVLPNRNRPMTALPVGSRTIGYLKTSVRCCMAERYFEKFWQHGKPVPRSCHADQSS